MRKTYHNETFERIPIERRRNLIKVATREFARKGFNNANINEIAAEAKVSVGSVYKYFNTKKDFFLTCIRYGLDILEEVLSEALQSDEDILIKAERIIRLIQAHSREHRDLIILYYELASESNAELTWDLAAEVESTSAKVYTALIEQAQREGLVRQDISPPLFAFFLDNLFMMLQFSYACDYYRHRFKIYAGKDIVSQDDLVVEQMLKFIRAAFEGAAAPHQD